MRAAAGHRRWIAVMAGVMVLSGLATPPAAQAGWVVFPLNLGGKSALVAENITLNGGEWFYTFAVANTTLGGAKIDGFFLGVGPMANALGGGMQFNIGAVGGADGPFPAALGVGGGTGLLTGVFRGATSGLAPLATAGWGFQEYDDRNALTGNLPATAYVMRWYDPIQGANNATDLPTRLLPPLGQPRIGAWLVTGAFQLVSTFGPVPGYGGIDPFSGGYLGLEDGGTLLQVDDPFASSNLGNGPPPNLGNLPNIPTPEPASLTLGLCGSAGAGMMMFRRRFRRHGGRAALADPA
jgi:hypothetical protein